MKYCSLLYFLKGPKLQSMKVTCLRLQGSEVAESGFEPRQSGSRAYILNPLNPDVMDSNAAFLQRERARSRFRVPALLGILGSFWVSPCHCHDWEPCSWKAKMPLPGRDGSKNSILQLSLVREAPPWTSGAPQEWASDLRRLEEDSCFRNLRPQLKGKQRSCHQCSFPLHWQAPGPGTHIPEVHRCSALGRQFVWGGVRAAPSQPAWPQGQRVWRPKESQREFSEREVCETGLSGGYGPLPGDCTGSGSTGCQTSPENTWFLSHHIM